MTDVAYDGTPIQSGAAGEHVLTGRDPSFSVAGLREMVVVERYFPDEPDNRSRSAIEYLCRDLGTGGLIRVDRRLTMSGGLDDGDDVPLHPAGKTRPGVATVFSKHHTRAVDTDGDRVLVGFIDGAHEQAVIVGVLQHTASTYGARKEDGERRLTTHKGTTIEVRSNGEYVVTHKSGASVTLADSGDVHVEPAAGKQVFLGGTALTALVDGVVTARGVDTFTGATYGALGNASTVVLAKKE